MGRRRKLLCGTALALAITACGVVSVAGSADDGPSFNAQSVPFMQYGGAIERSLRVVRPVHDAIWSVPSFL